MEYRIAIMGQVWDGEGQTGVGGFIAPYVVTRHLSEYFDCDMIFETDEKEEIGKMVDTGRGFMKGYIPKQERLWHLDEEFLEKYDLIHTWGTALLLTYRAHTGTFVPHCHTVHSAVSMMNWARFASAFLVPGYDVIALGSSSLANALRRFWKAPIEIVPLGVDVEFFKPMDKGECRERLNIPKEAAVLGYLGRIGKLDLIFVYETMRKVAEITGREDTLLVVAGGYRGAYHEIEPVYLKDDFIYLGFIQNSDAPLMLNSCDVFFNPVAGAWEGFGLTVVEAMACGLPVVTTNWDGYTDTVVDGKTGFLSRTCWKDGDVWINQQDLSIACARLIADEDLQAQMGKEARRRAEKDYKWEHCIDRYRKKFLELIDKGTPSEVPYSRAPQEINVTFDNTRRCYSLSEALSKRDELRLDFGKLYEDFVSNRQMRGDDWKRVVCADNITNLPKYRGDWETAFEKEKTRIKRAFPLIVKLSGYS